VCACRVRSLCPNTRVRDSFGWNHRGAYVGLSPVWANVSHTRTLATLMFVWSVLNNQWTTTEYDYTLIQSRVNNTYMRSQSIYSSENKLVGIVLTDTRNNVNRCDKRPHQIMYNATLVTAEYTGIWKMCRLDFGALARCTHTGVHARGTHRCANDSNVEHERRVWHR
jgi:hypothetical protein